MLSYNGRIERGRGQRFLSVCERAPGKERTCFHLRVKFEERNWSTRRNSLGGLKGGIYCIQNPEIARSTRALVLLYNYWTPSSTFSPTRSSSPLRPFVVRSSCDVSPPLAPPDFPALATSSSFRMAHLRCGKSFLQPPIVLSNRYVQVTLGTFPTCNSASLPRRSDKSSFPSHRYLDGGAVRLSSILVSTSIPTGANHRVGVIVGACLGAAGGVLLIGLGLFWILLRHRQHSASAQAQDIIPRSWAPSDFLRGHNIAVVANHPSLSLDLAGADADNSSIALTSEETSDTKRWKRSTDVLDISVENVPRSPLPSVMLSPVPEPIEPYVPTTTQVLALSRSSMLCIHTDVHAASTTPPCSQEGGTSAASSTRSPLTGLTVRPLPTPPTRSQTQIRTLRRHRSDKAEEVHRESRRSRIMSCSAISANNLHAHAHVHGDGGDRRSMRHSVSGGLTCQGGGTAADGCEIVQHHDGGLSARIDLPPPYSECLHVQQPYSPPIDNCLESYG